MNKRHYGLIAVLVLIGGLYLLNRKDVQLKSQNQFRIQRITENAGELQSVITFNNPNLLSSTIKSIEEDFFIDGKLIGSLNVTLDQGIPGLKESAFPVSVRFSREDFPQLFADTAQAHSVSVKGEISFNNLMSGGTITVDLKNVSVNSGTATQ